LDAVDDISLLNCSWIKLLNNRNGISGNESWSEVADATGKNPRKIIVSQIV
jgi:hypothetical protein